MNRHTTRNQSTETDTRVSIDVSAVGGSLDLVGNAAEKVSDTLADILSPLSQGLGWIGDKFSEARRASAIKAAARARKMLADEGIVKGDVPPKILLPWLEGASLELNDTESLTELWAGLLARAVKSSDAVNISYVETLKRLGKDEAKLLNFFATDTSPWASFKFFGGLPDGFSPTENPLLQDAINRFDEISTIDELRDRFEDFFLQGMGQIIFYSMDGERPRSTRYYDRNEHAISNLQHLGLIEVRRRAYHSNMHRFEFTWFEITKYAFDFSWACVGVKTGRGIDQMSAERKKAE